MSEINQTLYAKTYLSTPNYKFTPIVEMWKDAVLNSEPKINLETIDLGDL